MSTQEGTAKPSKNHGRGNQWATQSDRELITAARDSKTVELYFRLSEFETGEPSLTCKIEVVDRYFLRIMYEGASVWVAKSHLVGFHVIP